MSENTSNSAGYGMKQNAQHVDGNAEPLGFQYVVQDEPVMQGHPVGNGKGAIDSQVVQNGGQDGRARQGAYSTPQPQIQTQPQPQPPKQPRKRKVGFYIAIVIAVIAVASAAFFAYSWWESQQIRSSRDSNALIGQVEGKSIEEIRAELDRKVEEGMFQISIASDVEFEDGASEGEIKIENVPGNRYLMQVDITRNDTGDVIYESGILEPNYHIQTAKLDEDLPAGTYKCTATFNALDPETEEQIGSAAAEMTIRVLN